MREGVIAFDKAVNILKKELTEQELDTFCDLIEDYEFTDALKE